MPALLIRWLLRLATLGLFVAWRRRRGDMPPFRTPGWPGRVPPGSRREQALREAAEVGRIAWRTFALLAFLGAGGVLVAAGTTAVALGPRWVGIPLLVLAALALAAAWLELRAVWRLRLAQIRRRRGERIVVAPVPPEPVQDR